MKQQITGWPSQIRNRTPVYNYRWAADYSPGTPFISYLNFGGRNLGSPSGGAGGGGGTTTPPGGTTGGGTTTPPPGTRPPYQWTPPQLMFPSMAMPYGLGPDWRSTMMRNVPFPPNSNQ
jgi:hypothetical protein